MEIFWAIVLGGASLIAVIAAGLRRVDRERRAAAASPPLSSATPKPEAIARPPAPRVATPEPVAPPAAELPPPPASAPAARSPEPAPPPMPEPVAAPEPVAPPAPELVPAPAAPEPRVSPPEPAPPSAPVAPKLAVDPDDRELADIIAWGQSGQPVYLSLLSHYRYHPSAVYRCQAARAIGAIAAANPPRYEILRSLDTLAQLSGDTEAEVRRSAVDALAHIPDPQVVRLLQLALKDSDSEVVKTASAAIARFKTVPAPAAPAKKVTPARRPEPPAES